MGELSNRELDAKVAAVMGWKPSTLDILAHDAGGEEPTPPNLCAEPCPLKDWLRADERVTFISCDWYREGGFLIGCFTMDGTSYTGAEGSEGRALCMAVLAAFGDA